MSYFIFDDINTSNISNVDVFFDRIDEVPERIYEEIEIPARNGVFYLDKGRYENTEHVYHVVATSKASADDLINKLASKKGYYRLSDSFNTSEYYEAVFTGVDDIVVTTERDKTTFKVIFTRKPQRYLTSGETATTVANNGTMTNPTLFESSPLLEVKGYGNIGIGNSSISIQSGLVGDIKIADRSETEYYNSTTFVRTLTHTVTLDTGLYNVGDTIIPSGWNPSMWGLFSGFIYIKSGYTPSTGAGARINFSTPLVYGTSATLTGETSTATNSIKIPGGDGTVLGTFTYTCDLTLQYDGAQTLTFTGSISVTGDTSYLDHIEYRMRTPDIIVNSTYSSTSGTIYIDLDIGEAWTDNSGEIASINNSVALPAELPTLVPGSNTITFDNTITSFKIKPRWWKV